MKIKSNELLINFAGIVACTALCVSLGNAWQYLIICLMCFVLAVLFSIHRSN